MCANLLSQQLIEHPIEHGAVLLPHKVRHPGALALPAARLKRHRLLRLLVVDLDLVSLAVDNLRLCVMCISELLLMLLLLMPVCNCRRVGSLKGKWTE